jgi:tRNA dimethylallyltransferase
VTFFVVGPTAVGKSELAVQVAECRNAEILGADAFQIYAGLDILTAKPEESLRARVPHHLVGEVPLMQSFDVAQYLAEARRRIADIDARGKHALVVGGTGLYVRALARGLAPVPPANAALRKELEIVPLVELRSRLAGLDPVSAREIDPHNRRRLIRALEVCLVTGRAFSSFRTQWSASPEGLHGIVVTRERSQLYTRVDRRVQTMFAEGVVEEVREAGEIGPTASQTIGLLEIRALLAGKITRDECVRAIQQATRRYAKRQLTWFRRETAFATCQLGDDFSLDRLLQQLASRGCLPKEGCEFGKQELRK